MRKNLVVGAILSVSLMVGCSATETPVKTGDVETKVETSKEEPKVEQFKLGDVVTYGDLDFVVEGVREVDPGEYTELAEGEKVVAIDLIVTNNGAEEYTFSSIWSLRVIDNSGYEGTLDMWSSDKKELDGAVPPGVTKRGTNTFKVSDDVQVVSIQPEIGAKKIFIHLD